MTEHDPTFTRPELVRAVARRIGLGATVATVERTVARKVASDQVVAITDERTPRWTTTDLLSAERRFLNTAASTRSTRCPVVRPVADTVLGTIATLGVDQEAAVRTLVGSGDAVSVMVGPAGTGKTLRSTPCAKCSKPPGTTWSASPSARAAHELEADAHSCRRRSTVWPVPGNAATTCPRHAWCWWSTKPRWLASATSNASSARWSPPGGRVLLVGDHHQLPEVTTGGGFAALATEPTTNVAELTVNRRQLGWERDALAELRAIAEPDWCSGPLQNVAAVRDTSPCEATAPPSSASPVVGRSSPFPPGPS